MTSVSLEDIGAETSIKSQMAEIEALLKSDLNERPLKSVIISAGSRNIIEISEACKRLSVIHNIIITATLSPLGNGAITFTWRNVESEVKKPTEAKKTQMCCCSNCNPINPINPITREKPFPDRGPPCNPTPPHLRLCSSSCQGEDTKPLPGTGPACTPNNVQRCSSSCHVRGLPVVPPQLTTVTKPLPEKLPKFDNGDDEFEAVLASLREQGGNAQNPPTQSDEGVVVSRLREQFTKHHAAGGTLSWGEFIKLNVVILDDAYAETLVNKVLYACLNNNNNYVERASSFVYPVVVDCGPFQKCVAITKAKLGAKFPGYGYTILSGTDMSGGYTRWFIKVDDALRLRKTLKAQESR